LATEYTQSDNPPTDVILNHVDDDLIVRRPSRFAFCQASEFAGNTHWILTVFFILALIPAFRAAHLPLAVSWQRLLSAYWGGLAARAIFCAVLLWVIGFPLERTLKPLYARYMSQKARFLFLFPFAAAMIWEFGLGLGTMVIVDGMALAEILDRCQGNLESITNLLRPLLPASVYLFAGLVMVFAYNDLIAAHEFLGAYDGFFLKMDTSLLRGATVSEIAHRVLTHFSPRGLDFVEFVYYGMFGQIGAALIIVAFCCGKREALRYVGTILTAYYLALVIFYLWPSMGPFYTCSRHFNDFPRTLATYGIQQSAMLKARLLASPYKSLNRVDTDYFIAFPCMHVAQPLVVIWFLRRWKRVVIALVVYDLVLAPAILILEWHYLVDLLGGILVAIVAIALNHVWASRLRRKASIPL
jgi:hypothetical protein